jgi:hypothetical protein
MFMNRMALCIHASQFEARFERLLAAIQYPTARRLADIQLPFPSGLSREGQSNLLPPHFAVYGDSISRRQ